MKKAHERHKRIGKEMGGIIHKKANTEGLTKGWHKAG